MAVPERDDTLFPLRPAHTARRCSSSRLSSSISRALADGGGWRGALGNLTSWHLHAWSHATPFTDWASAIARAVERGHTPGCSLGAYDLRLDRASERAAWQQLLSALGELPDSEVRESRPGTERATTPSSVKPNKTATAQRKTKRLPLSVVIPVRNRAGTSLRNTLESLHWQNIGQPAEILIVDHGSDPDQRTALRDICKSAGARLIPIGTPERPWNKPLALNRGIRATDARSRQVLVMDADILLAPDFFGAASEKGDALVLCRCGDLPQSARIPGDKAALRRAFPSLRSRARLRPASSTGGVQWAPRAFFFSVQGYDEDLLWWGAMDNDMVRRAREAGLPVVWVSDETGILHQWHPRKHAILDNQREVCAAQDAWRRNHRLMNERAGQPVRNGSCWGGEPA